MAGGKPARILIDGTMARGGGGFTYLVNVVPRLAQMAPDDRFCLLLRSDRIAESIPSQPNLEIQLLPRVGAAGRIWFTAVEGARMASRWGADLYFSAGEGAPLLAPCPRIASFRNPNPFRAIDPEYSLGERLRLRALRMFAKLSARSCEKILFVSKDSARWIGQEVGLPAGRRAVIHHGVDPLAWQSAGSQAPIHPRPYIVSVSSIYRYKNFVRLIEAYAQLVERHLSLEIPDLVIIGDNQDPAYARKMEAARAATGDLAAHIQIVGEVPYHEIGAWYRGALLSVFPSYLETFGHPLLEAMAAEVPLVASGIPVFREIAGDAAFYADPHRPEQLAEAMAAALLDPQARDTLIKRGRVRLREFSWDRTASRLLTLFEDVLAERATARKRFPALQPTSAFARHPSA